MNKCFTILFLILFNISNINAQIDPPGDVYLGPIWSHAAIDSSAIGNGILEKKN